MMDFTQAVKSAFSGYTRFSGRAGRSEFWYWMLAITLMGMVAALLDGAIIAPMLGFEAFDPDAGQPLQLVLFFATFLPSLTVSVRRLHDTGRSGWWLLIQIIPLIGLLVLIWWYIKRSDEGDNEYGPPAPTE